MRLLLIVALASGSLLGWIVARAEPPACNAELTGMVTCIAGRLCSCELRQPGSISRQAAGYAWNCGIVRPACPPAEVEAAYPSWLPDSLELDLLVPVRP